MYEFYHYLPVDDSIMKFGLYLTGVGRGVIPSMDNYPPVGHPNMYAFDYHRGRILPEFQMILITDGQGIFESKKTGQVSIEPSTLIILFPDIWHRYKPDEQTGWKERWFSINGVIIHQLMELGLIHPSHAVQQLSEPEHLISIFDHFLDRIHRNPAENSVTTSLSTMAVLSEISELIGPYEHSMAEAKKQHNNNKVKYSKDDLVNSVLKIIWTQSHRQFSVDSILTQLPVSRRTLERRFQKFHGHSIYEEIIQCRLSRAKRLLKETHLPVKTVAYLSGFKCAELMRRSFERVLSQPPSEFRQQNSVINISDE